jgi:hypothetical protein
MSKYFINYGTGVGNEWVDGTLEDAMKTADENATYTQEPICIQNENGDVITGRSWYGIAYDENENDCEDPIKFGSYGFYADWTLN